MSNQDKSALRNAERAVSIVRDAGGRVVGRTRLQKIAFLLDAAGLGSGFKFEYRHYGPYSDELAAAVWEAELSNKLKEEEHPTSWGGSYSIYSVADGTRSTAAGSRQALAQAGAAADAVELELAATAVFLSMRGERDAWRITEKLKPKKSAGGRIEKARDLYEKLRKHYADQLPKIVD